MNLDAVTIFGRPNPPGHGRSPFTPLASGICIHADGVIATCHHAIERFILRWTIYDPPKKLGSELIIEHAEPQERPFLIFPSQSLSDDSAGGEADCYPMISAASSPEHDIAVLELGGGGSGRPFSFVPIAAQRPRVGDTVYLAGLYQDPEPPKDPHGYPTGFRVIQASVPVVALRPEGFLIDFPVIEGMSGSGICNQRGLLQGIIIERWESERSARLVGVAKTLGLCAYAEWVVEEYYKLLTAAKLRIATGGLPWGGRAESEVLPEH